MEIRLLIGAKLFCLTNEVRWRRRVTEEFLKFVSLRGRARADRIRMPFRIRFSIGKKILFRDLWAKNVIFFLPQNLFFSRIQTQKWMTWTRGLLAPSPPYWINGWVVKKYPHVYWIRIWKELKLGPLGLAADSKSHWHVHRWTCHWGQFIFEDNLFCPQVPTQRTRNLKNQKLRSNRNPILLSFRFLFLVYIIFSLSFKYKFICTPFMVLNSNKT